MVFLSNFHNENILRYVSALSPDECIEKRVLKMVEPWKLFEAESRGEKEEYEWPSVHQFMGEEREMLAVLP